MVLVSVTVEDVPQQEHEGGQGNKRHGTVPFLRVPVVITIPVHHIGIPRSRLPSALAGLFAAHRVYQTMSQGTVHLWRDDIAESCELYVV